jgi:hypothetical protein
LHLLPDFDRLTMMVASGNAFDSLVAELSNEERVLLLERIRTSMPVSSEPLYPAQAAPVAAALSGKIGELGLIPKLILFLRGLFSGKSREEIVREDELKEIGRRVEQRYPGLVDRRHGLILAPVAEELRGLRDASRFFYEALDRSVERDKGAFYAFLASLELPETHERLVSDADPASIAATMAESRGDFDDQEVRATAYAAFDRIFSDLSEKGRRAMYQDLRSVLFLKRLSGFLFDRLVGAFREGAAPAAQSAASFFDAREQLLDLGDILFSMFEPPSTALVEAIFFFADREELGKQGSDAASVLGADMAKAEAALDRIRSFNSSLPLGDILRLVSGDPGYLPRELPGGEDWLAIYKTFWRERIDTALDAWRSEHRNKELVEEIASFVGEPGPAGFTYISAKEGGEAPPIRIGMALTFLDAFYRGPFVRELNRPMKVVLVDGEFYRKDNRIEYTDAYNTLLRIPELLSSFDARLGPDGELGSAWISANAEVGTTAAKRRRLQSVARSAEEEAERIVKHVGSALRTTTLIIQGFLKGEAGGRYDSLANLSYIDGKSNKDFVRSLDKAKDRCEKAYFFLAEISDLDLSADE